MLKLPAILWGVALTLWGGLLLNPWLLVSGLVMLALGLFVCRWDVGAAPRRPETGGSTAAEPAAADDRAGGRSSPGA